MNPQIIHSGAGGTAGLAPTSSTARQAAARIAGAAYVAMFALAIFANFVVREGLVVTGDAPATVSNLRESVGLFRLGIGAFLVIFVLDVVIAWALHLVFREVDADRSLATAWFRLVYSVFLGVGVVFLVQALGHVSGSATVDPSVTMAAVETFEGIWLIGLVAFGVHLVLLGSLLMRSTIAAKALGAVVIVAGLAYVIDTFARIVMPNYDDVSGILLAAVAVPSMVGEGWLGVWLLTTKRIGSRASVTAASPDAGETGAILEHASR